MPSRLISTAADVVAYMCAPLSAVLETTTSYILLPTTGNKLGPRIRVDAAPERPLDVSKELLGHLADNLTADAAFLIVHSTEEIPDGVGPHQDAVRWIRDGFVWAECPLRGAWIITPTHWRSILCPPRCTCEEHQPQSLEEIQNSHYTRGLAAPAIIEVPAHVPDALTKALFEGKTRPGKFAGRAWAKALEADEDISTSELVSAILALDGRQNQAARHWVMARTISDDTEDYSDALGGTMQARPRWDRLAKAERILTTALPSIDRRHRAGVLCMLGWAEWLRGSTRRAMGWNNEALKADPRYGYAIGLRVLYETGSTPRVATVKDVAHRAS